MELWLIEHPQQRAVNVWEDGRHEARRVGCRQRAPETHQAPGGGRLMQAAWLPRLTPVQPGTSEGRGIKFGGFAGTEGAFLDTTTRGRPSPDVRDALSPALELYCSCPEVCGYPPAVITGVFQPRPLGCMSALTPWASHKCGKTRRVYTQLDKGPETPGTTRKASGDPFLHGRRGVTLLSVLGGYSATRDV